MKYILVHSNDFFSADNIDGRLQTSIYDTYEDAYKAMENIVVELLKINDKRYVDYIDNVLNHMEYTNVYLGEYEARLHTDYGKSNRYWKIIEVM